MINLTKHKIHHSGQDGIALRLFNDGIEVAAIDLALPATDADVKEAVAELRTQASFYDVRLGGHRIKAITEQIETGAVQ